MITNFEYNNDLRNTVEEEISNETWRIVNGMTQFSDGKQYEYLSEIYDGIDYLEVNSIIEDKTKLELAKRTVKTLESYITLLGDQIEQGARVDDTVETNDEIRNVSAVVSEMLGEFSNEEIKAVAKLNETIKLIQNILMVVVILMIIGFVRIMSKTKRKLVLSIKDPIFQLENMAGKIASGDFAIRAQDSKIVELEALTDSLNIMASKLEDLIEQNKREQQNLKKAEFNLLQAQIKPHFLYNTYDTIIWLAEQKQYEDVVNVVEALSTFYRISLSKGDEWITIEDEVKHVESYLRIQRYRYGSILDYEINIDPSILCMPILKLLLQPIVENAIYHGIKQVRENGRITISGRKIGKHIEISVADTGKGMDDDELKNLKRNLRKRKPNQSGYGLCNVYKRIKLYYGDKGSIQLASKVNNGTKVTLILGIKDI